MEEDKIGGTMGMRSEIGEIKMILVTEPEGKRLRRPTDRWKNY